MSNPHIEQVRKSLLDTLADLRNKEQPMDVKRALAVAQVANVLVESAKVENEYLKLTGQSYSKFLEDDNSNPKVPQLGATPSASNPFPVSVRHRLVG